MVRRIRRAKIAILRPLVLLQVVASLALLVPACVPPPDPTMSADAGSGADAAVSSDAAGPGIETTTSGGADSGPDAAPRSDAVAPGDASTTRGGADSGPDAATDAALADAWPESDATSAVDGDGPAADGFDPDGETAVGAPCVDTCAAEGDRDCSSGGVVECVVLDSGCLGFGAPTPCTAGTKCSGGVCGASCADECATAETRCQGDAVEACGQHDEDECLDWGPPEPCGSCATCATGACLPSCADACPSPGAAECHDNGVRVCGQAGGACCLAWGPVTPCEVAGDCEVGSCLEGACVALTAAEGALCDDGELCTFGDSCQQGTCVGKAMNPVVAGAEPVSYVLPVANVTFDVTLDGGPLPWFSFTDEDKGTLWLRNQDGALWKIGTLVEGLPSEGTFKGRVLPATYDIVYVGGSKYVSQGIKFPSGTAVVAEDVEVVAGATLKIDIPRASVTFDVRLNGAFLPSTRDSTNDAGIISLRSADGTITQIGWLDGAPAPYSALSGHVVAGTYDVIYENAPLKYEPPKVYPVGRAVLATGVVLSGLTTVKVDIPYVDATFHVTLNGAALPQAWSGTTGEGPLFLRDASGHVTEIGAVMDGAGGDTLQMRVLPGTYDVLYERSPSLGLTPAAIFPVGTAVLASGVVIDSTATVELDIPSTALALAITVGGAALPPPYKSLPGGEIRLRAPDGSQTRIARFDKPYSPAAGGVQGAVVPGTYDLLYESFAKSLSEAVVYPAGGGILASGVVIDGPSSLSVDIPVANVTFDFTLSGEPMPGSSSGDSGSIYLREVDGTQHFLGNVSHDLPGPELAGIVLPGAYGIAYHESYFTKSIPWGAGVLKPSASIADGTAVLVDMPTGALTVVVSLGADPIVGAEYATGYLYGMSAEGTLLTLSSVGFTEPKTVKSVMLPGTYALYYQANWFALTEWESGPLAPLTPLGCVTIMPTSP